MYVACGIGDPTEVSYQYTAEYFPGNPARFTSEGARPALGYCGIHVWLRRFFLESELNVRGACIGFSTKRIKECS